MLGLAATAGCDEKKAAEVEEKASAEKASDEKAADEKAPDEKAAVKTDEAAAGSDEDEGGAKAEAAEEDKGSVRLELGDDGVEWMAERARARLEDGKLRISASVMHIDEGTTSRRALTLSIPDFGGPGKYELKNASSHLTAVKLNLSDVKKAEEAKDAAAADEAATKAAKDAFGGASVILLMGGKVEITKVSDDFIDGTLTWSGVALRGPGKLSGEFHARIKKD